MVEVEVEAKTRRSDGRLAKKREGGSRRDLYPLDGPATFLILHAGRILVGGGHVPGPARFSGRSGGEEPRQTQKEIFGKRRPPHTLCPCAGKGGGWRAYRALMRAQEILCGVRGP